MSLLGGAVLAIWNGIDDTAARDFVAWHVLEHIPERVGVPGFLRGRRYVALDGTPRYFNFYETATLETLTSAPYLARLNDPTPWTRRVIAQFRDTIRTACRVIASTGTGHGAWIEAVRIMSNGATPKLDCNLADHLTALDGVVAVHILQGQADGSRPKTTESALRGQPDGTVDWVVLIEGVDAEALQPIRLDPMLVAALRDVRVERGLYRLQYALSKDELTA